MCEWLCQHRGLPLVISFCLRCIVFVSVLIPCSVQHIEARHPILSVKQAALWPQSLVIVWINANSILITIMQPLHFRRLTRIACNTRLCIWSVWRCSSFTSPPVLSSGQWSEVRIYTRLWLEAWCSSCSIGQWLYASCNIAVHVYNNSLQHDWSSKQIGLWSERMRSVLVPHVNMSAPSDFKY